MKTFQKILLISCLMTAFITPSVQAQLTAVGNAKGVVPSLTMPELKAIFKGEKQRWSDGTKVVVALMEPSTPLGGKIAEKVYNATGNDVKRQWLALVFQGKTAPPRYFTSEETLKEFVKNTDGAIGLVAAEVGDVAAKIIQIDGKKSF
jgi:ABC-type phosphate transport system substrate-binding protein